VHGWNVSSTSIEVHWSLIPVKYQRGPVNSYQITYQLSSGSPSVNQTVLTNMTRIEGLQIYSSCNVTVCGVSIEIYIGPCHTVGIWTDEDSKYPFNTNK